MIYGNRWLKDTDNTTISESFSIVADEYLNRLSMLEACTDEAAKPILEAQVQVLQEVSFKDIIEKLKQFWEKFKTWIKDIWDKIFHNDKVAEERTKKAEKKAEEEAKKFVDNIFEAAKKSSDEKAKVSKEFFDKFKVVVFKINVNDSNLSEDDKKKLKSIINLSTPIIFNNIDDSLITAKSNFIYNFIKRSDNGVVKYEDSIIDSIERMLADNSGFFNFSNLGSFDDRYRLKNFKSNGDVYDAVYLSPTEIPIVTIENGVFSKIAYQQGGGEFKPRFIDLSKPEEVKTCLTDLLKDFRLIHGDINDNINKLDDLKKEADKTIQQLNNIVEKIHNMKHDIITDIYNNKEIARSGISSRAASVDSKKFIDYLDFVQKVYKDNSTISDNLHGFDRKFYNYLTTTLSYSDEKIDGLTQKELYDLYKQYHMHNLRPENHNTSSSYDDNLYKYTHDEYKADDDDRQKEYENMYPAYSYEKTKMENFKKLVTSVKDCITVVQKKSRFLVKNRIGYIKGKQMLTNTMNRLILYMDREYKIDEYGEYENYNEV